jgi:ADP-ribose pyrophosphatase
MKKRKRKIVFQTEWFNVEQGYFDHIKSHQGKPYYKIGIPDGVMILAMTEAEEFVMVRQFRPALNKYTLEVPAGYMDGSESPEEAVVRELYEETGYICRALHDLGAGRMMLNRTDARVFGFFGTGAVKDPNFKGEEDIQSVLVGRDALKDLFLTGEYEQLAGLALLVLIDWKLGSKPR